LIRQKFAIVRPKKRHRERYPLVESQNIAIVNDIHPNGPFTMANFWQKVSVSWHGPVCLLYVARDDSNDL